MQENKADMAEKSLEDYVHCPFHLAMNLLEGRWKFGILYVLRREGTMRFKELERAVPGISTRMLTKELKHLESHGIVRRVAYATVPPKVEYSLTEIGESTAPVIDEISRWGERYLAETTAIPG
ncbi:helix-turn-helix transcriptional regulator [Rhodobacter sp. NTK016B]|uniref:winged helix-turn-helix transcriptional regulator n=1 Tax=Rhodobacter sp. NTK016B TaxID=2759676 RepID=UPI001A8C3E8C|nr:helix-turn-helix domain-containing protein [Rhodobacter sp. NTK016B]MBN8290612.1 helix-turn-helix transcriptional regulator [Rhodobacter sp. NTK016B]